MGDAERMEKRQKQILILTCLNFAMFLVLFGGLGYVVYQSASLVNKLQNDLEMAEQRIAALHDKFDHLDAEVVVQRIVSVAAEQVAESVREAIGEAALPEPLKNASERLENASENIHETREAVVSAGEAIQDINEVVKDLDSDEIAQRVSYHILKGLGDGFQEAAAGRKPDNKLLEN